MTSLARFLTYREEATQQAFDEEGYLDTGELGKVPRCVSCMLPATFSPISCSHVIVSIYIQLDAQGNIVITGRARELIVTSNGIQVAPVPIEEVVCRRESKRKRRHCQALVPM